MNEIFLRTPAGDSVGSPQLHEAAAQKAAAMRAEQTTAKKLMPGHAPGGKGWQRAMHARMNAGEKPVVHGYSLPSPLSSEKALISVADVAPRTSLPASGEVFVSKAPHASGVHKSPHDIWVENGGSGLVDRLLEQSPAITVSPNVMVEVGTSVEAAAK